MLINEENIFLRRRFDEFFTFNFPKIKNFAFMLLKSEAEAEDIAQDIFVNLWEQPHLWKDNDIQGYLYTLTKNRVLNHIKHKNIENAYEKETLSIQSLSEICESPLNEIYYKELKLILELYMAQMPKKRRIIFEMSRIHGVSHNEIANKLNLSLRTVEQHIYLALKELKKILLIALFFIFFK